MKKKPAAKVSYDGGKIDLRKWTLDVAELFGKTFENAVLAAASEALTVALKTDPMYGGGSACFKAEDKKVTARTAMVIEISFSLADTPGKLTRWSFSLRDAVDSLIDNLRDDDVADDHYSKSAEHVRDGLRALAQKIDVALAKMVGGAGGIG